LKALHPAYTLPKLKPIEVFHPKIYLFKNGIEANVVIGSANITSGGFENNFECSLWHTTDIIEALWLDFSKYFNLLCNKHSVLASQFHILQYETFYAEQKRARAKIRAIPNH